MYKQTNFKLIWLACYFVITFGIFGEASACSCVPNTLSGEDRVKESAVKADEVFLGKVLSSTVQSGMALYSVEVERVWKGQPPRQVVVASPEHGSMCGVSLVTDGKYVFYGRLGLGESEHKGYRFAIYSCDRAAVEEDEEDKAILDRVDIKKLSAL